LPTAQFLIMNLIFLIRHLKVSERGLINKRIIRISARNRTTTGTRIIGTGLKTGA